MSLSLLNIDDEEIIGAINTKYLHHKKLSEKYKLMLDAYNEIEHIKPTRELIKASNGGFQERNITGKSTIEKQTFETVVLNILKDGQPRLISNLINEYYALTNKTITTKDFSSKLSIRSKANDKIRNAKFNDFPIEKRYWWGLSDWFEGNRLKPEYEIKVHEKFKNMK